MRENAGLTQGGFFNMFSTRSLHTGDIMQDIGVQINNLPIIAETVRLNTDEHTYLSSSTISIYYLDDDTMLIVDKDAATILNIHHNADPTLHQQIEVTDEESTVMKSFMRDNELFILFYNRNIKRYRIVQRDGTWHFGHPWKYSNPENETITDIKKSASLTAIITNRHAYIYHADTPDTIAYRLSDYNLKAQALAGFDALLFAGLHNGNIMVWPDGTIMDMSEERWSDFPKNIMSFHKTLTYLAITDLSKITFGSLTRTQQAWEYNVYHDMHVRHSSMCRCYLTPKTFIVLLREEGVIEIWHGMSGKLIGEVNLHTNREPYHFGITPSGTYIYYYYLDAKQLYRLDMKEPRNIEPKTTQEKFFE